MYSFALVIQLALFAVYLATYRFQHPHTPAGDVVKRMCEIFIHAAPPGIVAVMLFCGASNRGRLQRQGITMHAVDCLKSVGEVEICVLDKTGTLTGSVVRSDGPPVLAGTSLVYPGLPLPTPTGVDIPFFLLCQHTVSMRCAYRDMRESLYITSSLTYRVLGANTGPTDCSFSISWS